MTLKDFITRMSDKKEMNKRAIENLIKAELVFSGRYQKTVHELSTCYIVGPHG